MAHSRPPCASMIERQIESPMPMSPDLVVKKAVNSRSAFSAEIPTPLRHTYKHFQSGRFRSLPRRGRSLA